MNSSPAIFFIFYIISVISVLGFGLFFRNIIFKNSNLFNIGFDGLIGVFILTFQSYLSQFIYSHNSIHNFFIIFTGLVLFILNFKKIQNKFEIRAFIAIYLLLFFAFIAFKTHDDFSYYHFGYTNYINEGKFLIGIGNFNHGFRTPSSIFYLNSLFFLPIVEKYMFHIGAIMIMGYSIIAVPTGIVTSSMNFTRDKYTKTCIVCNDDRQSRLARYCNQCGAVMPDEK